MSRISITPRDEATFHVAIDSADGTSSEHVVTVWPSDLARYAPDATPEELVQASFEFLLEREPKESILARFDLAVIERYFPDYPAVIRTRMG